MSYMVAYEGYFKASDISKADKMFQKVHDAGFDVVVTDKDYIKIDGQFRDYNEDKLFLLYDSLVQANIVENAEIQFRGEDGLFKHEIKDGKVRELTGNTIYQDMSEVKNMASKDTFGIDPYLHGVTLSSGVSLSVKDLMEVNQIFHSYAGYSMLAFQLNEHSDYDFEMEDILTHVDKDSLVKFTENLYDDFEEVIHDETGDTEMQVVKDRLETFLTNKEIEFSQNENEEDMTR